jgi:hypothetical protein
VGYIAKPLIAVRERDQDHPYKGLNWELPQLVVRIHQENLQRFYGDNLFSLLINKLIFYIRRDLFYLKIFLIAFYKQDHDNFLKMVEIIKHESMTITNEIATILVWLNYFRQRRQR